MEKIYSDTSYTIEQLVNQIQTGGIAVPDLQRQYVWKPADIRDLLDSMYKGYPIGYLLLWQSQGRDDDNRFIGVEERRNASPNYLIIDGQQRLTSLYAIMTGKIINAGNKQVKIAFNPITQKFEVQNASIERNPEWIPNISDIFISSASRKYVNNYIDRLNESKVSKNEPPLSEDEEEKIDSVIHGVYDLKDYPIGTLTINLNVDEETVAHIFTRVNSGGRKLTENDFILTLISVNDPMLRDDIENFCLEHNKDNIQLIDLEAKHIVRVAMAYIFKRARLKYAYQILRGIDLKRGVNKIENEEAKNNAFADLRIGLENVLNIENWQSFIKTVLSSGYINKSLISSQNTIIASYVIYLIGKYDFKVDNNMLRNLIARWFYMSTVKGRYTNSFETSLQEELNDLEPLEKTPEAFKAFINKEITLEFTNDYFEQNLPNDLETSSVTSPVWGAYLASLNVLNVKALFSDLYIRELLSGNLDGTRKAVERHHLFPKAYLNKNGIVDDTITNQIANYAYIEWPDNMEISDDSPDTYFPQMVEKYIKLEDRKDIKNIHALPDEWYKMNYEDFLIERRKLMAKVIKLGYDKLTNQTFI